MKRENNNSIGFLGLLTIAFIVLKLCKVIDWEWAWVLFPIWGPFIAAFIIVLITAIVTSILKE